LAICLETHAPYDVRSFFFLFMFAPFFRLTIDVSVMAFCQCVYFWLFVNLWFVCGE